MPRQMTPKEVLSRLVGARNSGIRQAIAAYLNIPVYSLTLKKLEWLGLLSDRKLNLGTVSVFEMFAHILKHRLLYNKGEMDLLVMHHELEAIYPQKPKQRVQSTLIDHGIQGDDSSMSRTVGYPVGIAAQLIASGKLSLRGVALPIHREIYAPILDSCKKLGIHFVERHSDLEKAELGYWRD